MHSHLPAAQRCPLGQRVPVPVQGEVVQLLPMGRPQSTALAAGQPTLQTQRPVLPSQVSPLAQRVPVPHDGPPGHTLGTGAPHATSAAALGSGHRGTHSHARASTLHRWPAGQGWSQRPPQPSSAPHAASGGHRGVQVHMRVVGSQVAPSRSQRPRQRPPQPSSAPQSASGAQVGVHSQRPNTQRSLGPREHPWVHAQVSMHEPFTHTDPALQVTAAQRFRTHWPSAQNSPSAQVTPSQGVRGVQVTWQVDPSGHAASQG
jgi:hypothetical protein